MGDVSDRLALPLLAAGQAQKEMTHNEALALLDIAVQPVVVAVAPAAVPSAPVAGQCWIVGLNPAGAWSGHAGALAAWTAGGWRFVAPFEGMAVWSVTDSAVARRTGTAWIVGALTGSALSIGGQQVVGPRLAAVPAPAGGATIDGESRAAIAEILGALAMHGLISRN